MTDDRIAPILVQVTPKLKNALIREAREQKINVNEVAVRAIAEEFNYPLSPPRVLLSTEKNGSKKERGRKDVIYLRMPSELKQQVAHHAVDNRVNLSWLIRDILAAKFGVKQNNATAIARVPVGGQPR